MGGLRGRDDLPQLTQPPQRRQGLIVADGEVYDPAPAPATDGGNHLGETPPDRPASPEPNHSPQ